MGNNIDAIRHYEDLVFSRRRGAPSALIPDDHRVNWSDAPSKFSIYPKSARVPLSDGLNFKELRLGKCKATSTTPCCEYVSIEELSDFLLLTAGILRSKLSVNWSLDGTEIAAHQRATYTRGTASGGGLYPVAVYLLLRDRLAMQPGLYHYDDAHHGLTRLRLGNFESLVATAVDHQRATSSDLLVILTVRFWKSIFKYHNFSYQVVTQDIGASIGSMEQVAHALGWNITVIYWFRDRLLSALLGLDFDNEAPFAVLTASKNTSRDDPKDKLVAAASPDRSVQKLPDICHRIYERSRKTFLPEMLLRIHKETLLEEVSRPFLPASTWPLSLKSIQHKTMSANLCSLLTHRETSWGRFRREPALGDELLRQVLGFVAYGVQYNSDLYQCRVALPSLRIALIAQYVTNLPQGVYDYGFSDSRLTLRKKWACQSSLQPIYFLPNHNLDQVAAVLVVVGRIGAALSTLGGRGIRVMNAEAGMAAQRAYIATAALSLGCGAALGFDAHQISEILALDNGVEIPLLLIFIGHQCETAFAYDFPLC